MCKEASGGGRFSAAFSQGQEIPSSSNVFWPTARLLVKHMTITRLPISGLKLDPGDKRDPLVVKIRQPSCDNTC